MTVIATFISKPCTVHATDSLLTAVQPDGTTRFQEWRATKIVQVRPWRGAIAYYGLAGWENGWQMLSWLRTQAESAGQHASPQAFAEVLATGLQAELVRLRLVGTRAVGTGLHFSAYERVDDRWVPELFHIRNVQDPSYKTLFPDGVRVTRETWGVIKGQDSDLAHGDRERRLEVQKYIQDGGWLRFNNGDPEFFNTVAIPLQNAVALLNQRGHLRPLGVPEYTAIAHRSVELVARLQDEVGRPEKRRVGGLIHDLAITPEAVYSSTSGDET